MADTNDKPATPSLRPSKSLVVLGFLGGLAIAAVIIWVASVLLTEEPAAGALGAPRYVERGGGVGHVYDGEFTFFVGGGVAVLDCDDDGFPDLFFAGGANPSSLYRNVTGAGGEFDFEHLADPATDLTDVVGAYPLDVDSDGHSDLVVLRLGENIVLRGLGACRFERANETWGVAGGDEWTAAFSATWEAGESFPTLAFGNYLELDSSRRSTGACSDNLLIRPAQDGMYAEPFSLTPGWCTLSILFSDWQRSGRRDLRMANDRHYYVDGEEQLWRIEPGEMPRLYTAADGWQSLQIWGMGIASYDVTGDGLPEVVLTSQGDNKLQTLEPGAAGPTYVDIAIRRGATAHRPYTGGDVLPSTAWHPEFQDVNNDGYIDLYLSKGNVDAMVEYAAADPSNLLLGQPDGTFVEGAMDAGIVSFARTRGAALVDLDLDGLLDIVEVNRRENVRLLRNLGVGGSEGSDTMGAWLALRLAQPPPNRDAVGAWIQVRAGDRTMEREVTVGGGHAGGQLGWIHFGLGDADAADVRVQWPDGETSDWQRVDAGSFAIVERGADDPVVWSPLPKDEGS